MPAQNMNDQQPTQVIASPNPTIDDSKTPADGSTNQVKATTVTPTTTVTQAPMKTTKKSKSKQPRKKPQD